EGQDGYGVAVLPHNGVAAERRATRPRVDVRAEATAQSAEDVASHPDGGRHQDEEARQPLQGPGDRPEGDPREEVASRRHQVGHETLSDVDRLALGEAVEAAERMGTSRPEITRSDNPPPAPRRPSLEVAARPSRRPWVALGPTSPEAAPGGRRHPTLIGGPASRRPAPPKAVSAEGPALSGASPEALR